MDESGHDESWEQKYERLAPKLLLYARQWLAHAEDAEDAVHEAFLRTWKRRSERLQDAYYFAATRSATIDLQRKRMRRSAREQQTVGEELFDNVAHPPALSAQDAEAALLRLPEEQREAVVLKIWGDLTFSEIARVTSVAVNTAASRYRYGIESIRKFLECHAS